MLANTYAMEDLEEAEIKIECEDIAADGGDGGRYILSEDILQYKALTPEEANNICNFAVESNPDAGQSSSTSLKSNSKHTQDAEVIYAIAITYICPSCGDEFEKQSAWKHHLNRVHEFNTPRGINFVPIDKLYHRCLECHKAIAMYSMEHLLYHKFLHLPHSCTKCKICHRRYKYRQNLNAHLRLCHRAEVLSMMASAKNKNSNSCNAVEIKDVKSNAVDLFANTNTSDCVEVKNEPFDPDDIDAENLIEPLKSNSQVGASSFLEDARCQSSFQVSDQCEIGNDSTNREECVKYIQYICPACSLEFTLKCEWFEHVQEIHDFCTIKGLGFQQCNYATVECKECKRVMSDKSIEELQLHKFSHLSSKAWIRCKLCFKRFSSHKNITNHLLYQHGPDEYDAKFVVCSNDTTLLDPTNDNKDIIVYEVKFLDEDNNVGIFPKDDASKSYVDGSREKGRNGDIIATRAKRFKCSKCYSTFSTAPALQKHNREQHGLKEPPPRIHAFPLSLEDVRSCNRAVDHDAIIYHCPQCNELFDTHTPWRLHIGAAHDLNNWKGLNFRQLCEKIYVCLECYKRVVTNSRSTISQLQWHKLRHLPYKSFSCSKCNKFFVHKNLFFKHLNPDNKCPMSYDDNISKINKSREKSSTEDSTMGLVRAISAYIGNPSFATQKTSTRCGSLSKSTNPL